MKNILLPTDFSSNSKNAITYALNFFREEVCKFTLLHAYEVDGFFEGSTLVPIPNPKSLKAKQESAEKNLKDFLVSIKSHGSNPNHTFKTLSGNHTLSSFIYNTVISHKCDLVVIGTQGISSSRDVAFGDNTKKIIKEVINCPILAIPSHVKFSNLKEVVLASGFKTKPRAGDLAFLKKLVKQHNSQIKILFIDDGGGLSAKQEKNKHQLFLILDDTSFNFHSLVNVPIPVGLYCFTESRESNLLVLMNRRHSLIENILFNPLSTNVGKYITIPVLVIQQP